MKITEALRGVTRLGVDTSALIDLVYSNPRSAPTWKGVLSRVETGNLVLVSSSLLLVELLAIQEATGRHAALAEEAVGRLNLVDLSQEIARLAALIRRDYGLKTPDAVHLATAVGSGCEAFLSADSDFSRVTGYPLPFAPARSLKVILVQDAT